MRTFSYQREVSYIEIPKLFMLKERKLGEGFFFKI